MHKLNTEKFQPLVVTLGTYNLGMRHENYTSTKILVISQDTNGRYHPIYNLCAFVSVLSQLNKNFAESKVNLYTVLENTGVYGICSVLGCGTRSKVGVLLMASKV